MPNKRQMKKNNKKEINTILEEIPFTITKKTFGNGYFMFTFEGNTVCWFGLKEFPNWKFGVWLRVLDDNEVYIFGENVYHIDKFKPTATKLSCTDINTFNQELVNIYNKTDEWKEYLESAKEEEKRENRTKQINDLYYKTIFEEIQKINKEEEEQEDKYFLKLVDRNTKYFNSSPRFNIQEYLDEELQHDNLKFNQIMADIYMRLSKKMSEVENEVQYNSEEDDWGLDIYIFDGLSTSLLSEKRYEEYFKYNSKRTTLNDFITSIKNPDNYKIIEEKHGNIKRLNNSDII